MKEWESVTKKRRLDMLRRVVLGKICPLPIKQVAPMHVLDVLTPAARQNGPSVAAEAMRSMAGVFVNLATATLRVERDLLVALGNRSYTVASPAVKSVLGFKRPCLGKYAGLDVRMKLCFGAKIDLHTKRVLDVQRLDSSA